MLEVLVEIEDARLAFDLAHACISLRIGLSLWQGLKAALIEEGRTITQGESVAVAEQVQLNLTARQCTLWGSAEVGVFAGLRSLTER